LGANGIEDIMATADTTTKPMTAEEFCDFVHRPENDSRWFELVRGEVIELPPPLKPHGVIQANAGRLLGNYTFKVGRFYVVAESGVILERDPDTVRGPDVAVYDDAEHFDDVAPKYAEVAPLLTVEILSPNDRADQVTKKITDYLRSGVALVWLIDSEARDVTVYTPDNGPRVFGEKDTLTGGDVLPGLKCKVADFFRMPGDKPPTQRKRKK
jgi:Uma2 family endonuclease